MKESDVDKVPGFFTFWIMNTIKVLEEMVLEPLAVATVMSRTLPDKLQVREVARFVTPVQTGEVIFTVPGVVTLMMSLAWSWLDNVNENV